jgi:hypothetical protein
MEALFFTNWLIVPDREFASSSGCGKTISIFLLLKSLADLVGTEKSFAWKNPYIHKPVNKSNGSSKTKMIIFSYFTLDLSINDLKQKVIQVRLRHPVFKTPRPTPKNKKSWLEPG